MVVCKIILITLICYLSVIRADDKHSSIKFCPIGASVDLTHATKNDSGFITDNGLFFPVDSVKIINGVPRGCICDVKPCLAVCPPNDETGSVAEDYIKYSAIPIIHDKNLTIHDQENLLSRINVVVWEPCNASTSYYLHPEEYEGDEFYLQKNGLLFLPKMEIAKYRFLELKDFCLKLRFNDSVYTPRVCASLGGEIIPDNIRSAKYIAALVSIPFLIATVIVYSILPELRNIHGTTLRCYLSCLIVTYVALAIDRIPEADFDAGTFCLWLGFTIYFSFLASFFWLNVMCFDMWWRFGGLGILPSNTSKKDCRQFFYYSIYAWGLSVLMTAICVGMEFSPLVPDSMIRPGFQLRACWFDSKTAEALYFYGPIGVIIVCNICLFILTSLKIFKYIKKTHDYRSDDLNGERELHDRNKHWFKLHIKLFIVMGIAWSTEIISWIWKEPQYLWLVTDMVNALQGVFIFVIFVCKRSIWRSIKKHFCNRNKQCADSQLRAKIYSSHNSLPDLSTTQLNNK